MSRKTVYILHKNGAAGHHLALEFLLQNNGYELVYREFGIFTKIFRSIISFNMSLLGKQFTNILFLFALVFTKNKKIVVGIAPYDRKIKMLRKFLKGHQIYYHTSWACWDKTFQPKSDFSDNTLYYWKDFIENITAHIFTVTNHSKNEILKNYDIPNEKISVVKHSLSSEFLEFEYRERTPNSFIYIGRLVPQKGIEENLEFFKKNPQASLTVVGKGNMENVVKKADDKYNNITLLPYISKKSEIIELLRTKEYIILNSKKTKKWEELFGLVIIEAMSQGAIPISTDHTGPREIIDSQNGYLVEEGEMNNLLEELLRNVEFPIEMSKNCIENSKIYSVKNISSKWHKILDS